MGAERRIIRYLFALAHEMFESGRLHVAKGTTKNYPKSRVLVEASLLKSRVERQGENLSKSLI